MSGEDSNGTADIQDTPRRSKRRTVPPIIDLEQRGRDEGPVTPVDVHVVRVDPLPSAGGGEARPLTDETGEVVDATLYTGVSGDPMTMTGSLPILGEVAAAIEKEKKMTVERTTAEQRADDVAAQINEIKAWWKMVTLDDIEGCMAKAEEYGSGDLEMMGQAMLMLQGDVWEGGDAAEKGKIGQELAILFYIHGKVARALAAAKNGRPCSDDTIKDIRIYGVMLQRVRETGKWIA